MIATLTCTIMLNLISEKHNFFIEMILSSKPSFRLDSDYWAPGNKKIPGKPDVLQ